MQLNNLIRKEHIILGLRSSTVSGCLGEILLHLEVVGAINRQSEYLIELIEREENSSTVLYPGIAFPHVRSSSIISPVIAIGRSFKRVDFKSVSGEKAEWIFLMLLPKEGNYLWVFSELLECLSSPCTINKLKQCNTTAEIKAVLNKDALLSGETKVALTR